MNGVKVVFVQEERVSNEKRRRLRDGYIIRVGGRVVGLKDGRIEYTNWGGKFSREKIKVQSLKNDDDPC